MRVVCADVALTYHTRGQPVEALQGVTFAVQAEEVLCVLGPSGCGKTTLLKILAGLLPPSRGRVEFLGERNGSPLTAMVFQEHGLFPWMTVLENITFGLEMRGMPRSIREREAQPLIETAGLARFRHSYPHELSSGMKQRVGLIRAFVTNPEVLLMDEPFASLDAQTKLVLQEEFLRLLRARPKPVIYVTHDIDESILLGDRILVLTGRPGEVRAEIIVPFARPRTLEILRTADFADLKGRVWRELEQAARSQARA